MATTGENISRSFQTPPRPPTVASQDYFTSPSSLSGVRRRKPNRSNQKALPERTDKTLVNLLLSPQRHTKFAHICQGDLDTYGTPGSALRKRVQNRRSFLKNLKEDNNDEFIELCKSLGILTQQEDPDVS
jgi:hypothetical protein